MAHEHGEVDELEPLWWGLFAAGGGLTAMFTPAHILLQNVLGAIGLPVATSSYERTRRLAANPIVRLYLLALTSLSLFHWAHRFRYYLMDFGVSGGRRAIAAACYGSAILGTLGALVTLLRLPGGKA
ncbi:MAG TPA: fumarate reductase subunit FrdD [Chloroflexota bacterium]|nr:fumarate reductase subunit FrdD [Chloroflexota bacterium]